jgi:hypothetical protein
MVTEILIAAMLLTDDGQAAPPIARLSFENATVPKLRR